MDEKKIVKKICGGKLLRLSIAIEEGPPQSIRSININGDFFAHPESAIEELESGLIGKTIEYATIREQIDKSLRGCVLIGLSQEELLSALISITHKDSR